MTFSASIALSDMVSLKMQDMDMSTYVGRIETLKKYMALMPAAAMHETQTDKLFLLHAEY